MTIFLSIISVFIIAFIGYCILIILCGRKIRWGELFAFSYGLGAGIIFLQMFWLSLLGIQWSLFVIFFPWTIIVLFLVVKKKLFIPPIVFPRFQPTEVFLLILVSSASFFVLISSVSRPVSAWDAWAVWISGGKALFWEKAVIPDVYTYLNTSNPPLINCVVAFTFLLFGYVDDQAILLLFSSFYVFLLILFYQGVQKFTGRKLALLFTFLLATLQNMVRHGGRFDVGNADLPLAYYMYGTVVLLLSFIKKPHRDNIILLSVFSAFGALVKEEGVVLFILVHIVMVGVLIKKHLIYHGIFLLSGVIIFLSWYIFKISNGLLVNPFLRPAVDLTRTPLIVIQTVKEFLNIRRWNILWIVFALTPFLKMTNEAKIVMSIFSLQLASYITIYFTTPINPEEHIRGSFDRLLLQITPLAMFVIAVVTSNVMRTDLLRSITKKLH